MTSQEGGPRRPQAPAGYDSWWSTERQLWWRDIDLFGHLTAGSYSAIYHDVFGDFATEVWQDPEASYVAARLAISYLHEIRLPESPVRVHVRVDRVGRSGFDATLVLCSSSGRVCSIAEASYAAWDPERRGARPMTSEERAALLAHAPALTPPA